MRRQRISGCPLWAGALCVIGLSLGAPVAAIAQTSADARAARQLLRDFAGSSDAGALLRHSRVRPQLQQLLGTELAHLERNLDVKGTIDVIGGDLSIEGNAPHLGTEEEAVVCVRTHDVAVSAAILSKGTVTVYTYEKGYDALSQCIKDWITQANSLHRDRVSQPANVRLVNRP